MGIFKKVLAALLLGALVIGGSCASMPSTETGITKFYKDQQATSVMLAFQKGDVPEIFPIGTGGIVGLTDDGKLIILTARHCITFLQAAPNWHLLIIKDGAVVEGTIVSDYQPDFSPSQDYAYVICDNALGDVQANDFADREPILGERVYASPMFPWLGVPTTLEGRVASISPDGRLMIIQIQGYYGMSGSNVVDASGKIIGVLIVVSTHGMENTPIGGTSLCVVVRVS